MLKLSDATAKGRRNTAGCARLAVFFLACLFVFSGCPANASGSKEVQYPFVKDGKIYSFSAETAPLELKAYDILGAGDGYSQKAVSASKKTALY